VGSKTTIFSKPFHADLILLGVNAPPRGGLRTRSTELVPQQSERDETGHLRGRVAQYSSKPFYWVDHNDENAALSRVNRFPSGH